MSRISWCKRLVALGLALWLIVGLLGSAPWASFGQGPPSPEVVGKAPRTPSLAPTPTGAALQHGRGYVPPPVDLSHLDGRWRVGPQLASLPDQWDWREQGSVTAVRDQLNCGSCYAFATLASFESQLLIAGEGVYDLSENRAAFCNYEALYVQDLGGCHGGNIWMVTNLYSTQGAELESCDPYTYDDETCHTTCPLTKTVTDMWELGGPGVPLSSTLRNWLYNYGPLYVTLDAGGDDDWGDEFRNYDGFYTLYNTENITPNHAVLLVGWNDTLTHTGPFDGAWIVKNSWGTGWGDGGYFTIAYGSAGIGSWAALIKGWQDYDPDGSLLYLDEAGMQTFAGCDATTAWGLARLTPGEDGCATQVEMWTNDVATVTLSIYDDFIYDDPDYGVATGLLWSSEDNAFDHAGYHSIPIQPPLPVIAGNDVNVMVKVENDGYGYPLICDDLAPVQLDQSFGSCSGDAETWSDLVELLDLDIGIRLRVAPCPECKIYLPVVLKEWAPATPP